MDPVLLQLQKDLAGAQIELKTAQKDRQTAEKEKQKAEKAYAKVLDTQKKALDALADANDNLSRAQSDLKQAIKDYSDEINRMLADEASLEAEIKKARGEFDAGEHDDFPDALSSDIDSLAFEVDNFSVDIGSYERAVQSAQKVVSTAKASATRAVNLAVKKQAEVANADAALIFAQQAEADAQKKVDAAQDALNNYKPQFIPFNPNLEFSGRRIGKYTGNQLSQEIIDVIANQANAIHSQEYIDGMNLVINGTNINEGVKAFDDYIASGNKWPTSDQGVKILAMKNASYLKMGVTTPKCKETIPVISNPPKSDSSRLMGMLANAGDVALLESGGFSYVSDWDETNRLWMSTQKHDVDKFSNDNSDLITYTGGSYTGINRTLWGYSDEKRYVNYSRMASEQILNYGVPYNRIVCRGVGDPVDRYLQQLPDGALFVSENFSSTSFGSGFGGYKMYIRVPAGMAGIAINQISHVPSEKEVLLAPFLTVRIIKHVSNGVICEAI